MDKIYAITFKDTGKIVTAKSFKEFWKNYGNNQLYGWRSPKKIYFTLGQAKAGFSHIPSQLKPLLEISSFVREASVIDGEELSKQQEEIRVKKEENRKVLRVKRELLLAERQVKLAQDKLNKLKA